MPDQSQYYNTNDFDDLFRAYYKSLRAYAYRYVGDLYIAEDIVQDVFSQLWEKKDNISNIESLRSYLFTSVYNRVCNYFKHKKVEAVFAEKEHTNHARLEACYQQKILDNSDSLLVHELEDKISDAVHNLPDVCKKVFLLSREKGLKNLEIAELLDINIKTVEKHITKALAFLRTQLKDYIY